MPGSTAPVSKAESSTASDAGIFVRPVAVAGIFRPVVEEAAKPPAVPTKRRFSALVGDLTTCASGVSSVSDDFNRRRQSWDLKQKEPFGQAQLKKTPRTTTHKKSEVSCNVVTSRATEQPSNLEPSTPSEVKTDAVKRPEVPPKSEELARKLNATTEKPQVKISDVSVNNKASENTNTTEISAHIKVKNESPPKVNSSTDNRNVNTAACSIEDATQINSSIESSKHTKKVYGLAKKDVKPDISTSKNQKELDTKSPTLPPANKTKVYGVNKVICKTESEKPSSQNLLNVHENSFQSESSVIQNNIDKSDSNMVVEDSSSEKLPKVPKDVRTVRRTSSIIAATIQNMFSNFQSNKPPEITVKKRNSSEKVLTSLTTKPLSTDDTKNQKLPCDDKVQSSSHMNLNARNDSKWEAAKSIQKMTEPIQSCDVCPESGKFSKAIHTADNRTDSRTDHINVDSSNRSEIKMPAAVLTDKHTKATGTQEKIKSIENRKKIANESMNGEEKCTTEPAAEGIESRQTKQMDLDREGKVPIKNANKSGVDGAKSFILAPNEKNDHKSTGSAMSSTTVEAAKKRVVKKLSSVMSGSNVLRAEIPQSLNRSTTNSTTNQSVIRSESLTTAVQEPVSTLLEEVPSNESTPQSEFSRIGSNVCQSNAFKTVESAGINSRVMSKTSKINNCVEQVQVSKIEVTKITPSTVPGIVPTVNVLFRTRSPQALTNRDENRKKVVIETHSASAPFSSPSIFSASGIKSDAIVTSSSKGTVAAMEHVQVSLQPPKESKRHSIVNLQQVELASVPLTPTNIDEVPSPSKERNGDIKTHASMLSNTTESTKEVSEKHETIASKAKFIGNEGTVSSKAKFIGNEGTASSKAKFIGNDGTVSSSSDLSQTLATDIKWAESTSKSKTTPSTITYAQNRVLDSSRFLNSDFNRSNGIDPVVRNDWRSSSLRNSYRSSDFKPSDSKDWNRRFNRPDSDAPQVPLRRRAFRDSLPPSLPLHSVSRTESLKRPDDCRLGSLESPRYLPRSPSQSCIPQRYSYTEMLSKVCSLGVLPYTNPNISRSVSSSSSQVSELWSELSEEQATASHATEMLDAETTERMRLEKEVLDLQNRCSTVQQRSDKMEMEMMESRVFRTPELNGDISDDDGSGSGSLYKQKYERAVRDMEIMKRRFIQLQEEETEQKAMIKKAADKKLSEAVEDVEEERQVAAQWKRKAQKLGSELQDTRLMLEEQMGRNAELEKKQRRFDAELSASQEEIKKEKVLREKFMREKEQAVHEKYSLEQDLQSSKLDSDMLHEKITQLNRELDELTLSSKGEEEVTQLKRAKQELERKSRDQEEELEELAAQVGMLEQAKLRLEMSLEKLRQEHRREASVREEEVEEIRASFSKKLKNVEAQLESEQEERHQLLKQRHELERRVFELGEQPPPSDPETERRLRRDLKRTKALLRDAQAMLEHHRGAAQGKTLIRQLKNQLEDSEFAKVTAIKARQAVEAELHDCQLQLEEVTRTKNEAESRCLQLSREKSAIQTQLEEAEEEMAEVMKKYKAVVAQMSIDQKALAEQNQQISELESERQILKDQLSEVSHKFEHLAGQSDDTHKVHWLDSKVRDLDSKLELEQTTKTRLENQIARLKEHNERSREECESLRTKELQAQESVRRLQRQLRDLREDYSALQQKESDGYRKQHELEMALENIETDLQVTKNDLRLACQRIQDLQNALEDDLDSGTDVPEESGSESDSSFEMCSSVLRNSSTPVQRCDSVSSNLSYDMDGHHSQASSIKQEISAFGRMMLQRRSLHFLG